MGNADPMNQPLFNRGCLSLSEMWLESDHDWRGTPPLEKNLGLINTVWCLRIRGSPSSAKASVSNPEKLNRRGKPQVLVHASTCQGKPFWVPVFRAFDS